ncbi:MAG: valine--tRNA ligase [Proteobacteria bacterium]|nr:valine--tRNA ligase [Pseudomonadota bacterium]MBU1582196.1 valine--tRNA ligase [Pseudomonadota bacterium]MBU2451768.1 valine--tRNA ligase [Pseudomonadota bacterium]MBU2627119.1 valine--tRNA ligase [Pseudomonadota bacterium]
MESGSLDKGYEPSGIEKKWYTYWLDNGFFKAEDKSDKKAFSIVIPPPNVTGVLHMGHALNNVIQDVMCRYRRLLGYNVLWMPGTDHAGIATQNVVERALAAKGKTRDQLGREEFIKQVWKWREKSGGAIINQLKRLGASCDWDRERFTMDEGLSDAVRKVFVRLYKEGLIYQALYIINWCPRCKTALADLEVEYEEQDSYLYYIRYPFANKKKGLTVATTRPETMFGDTAVAVNPDDERFKNLEQTHVMLPLTDRMIPIIRDEYVDIQFGTGALKVTPAHDPNDFHLGEKHGLEKLKVIDDDGLMLKGAGEFEGLDRFECRKKAVEALTEQGFLVKKEPIKHKVGNCYRCRTVVEPSISKQWFVKVEPLAKKASDAVRNGRTRIIPDNWEKTYFEWMDNIRDWCISRQIWWGHRIPVWKCSACNEVMVEEIDPTQCTGCGSSEILQETDVLDTWFSSALWPFSTMGWPQDTDLLKTFYPTNVLVTGFDILFFWVARMMMMGLHFMDEVPFDDVYIHALVRDEQGKKMSKSKGNVIDPLKVIDEYGADAFRFTLIAFAAQGRDVKMSESRVEGYRHFVNKLWNASRFALMHITSKDTEIDLKKLSLSEKWILSRCAQTSFAVKQGIETYKFNEAASAVYQFVWHEFCDWFIETAKPALYEKEGVQRRDSARSVLSKVLEDILIMLHPFMPFVTEEIYSILPATRGSVMAACYPYNENEYTINRDEAVEKNMEFVFGLISGIRNIRSEMNVQPSMKIKVLAHTVDEKEKIIIAENKSIIVNLATLERFSFCEPGNIPSSCASSVTGNTTCFVSLEGVIDFDKEIKRIEKDLEKNTKELLAVQKRLHNESFLEKAPEEVIQKVKDQHTDLEEKNNKFKENLERILKMK